MSFPAEPSAFLPPLFLTTSSSIFSLILVLCCAFCLLHFRFKLSLFINVHFFFPFQLTFFLPYKKDSVKIELLYLSLHVCVVYLGYSLSTAFYYSFMPLGYPNKKLPEQSWCPKASLGKFACLFVCSFSCIFIWHGLTSWSVHFFGYNWGVWYHYLT